MTWGEAIYRALCHYADTAERCEVFRTVDGWAVVIAPGPLADAKRIRGKRAPKIRARRVREVR